MDDEGWTAPIPLKVEDVVELEPHWEPIAQELAARLQFDYGAWDNNGDIRRIGSCQDPFGRVSPVLLFLPPGAPGDSQILFREPFTRTGSTVFLPAARWLTAAPEAPRIPDPLRAPRPVGRRRTDPAIPPHNRQTDWCYFHEHQSNHPRHRRPDMEPDPHRDCRKPVDPAPRARPGGHAHVRQAGKTPARAPARRSDDPRGSRRMAHPLKTSPDYDRTCKAFQRLQQLLCALVPLPGKPFRRSRGGYVPLFQVRIRAEILATIQQQI